MAKKRNNNKIQNLLGGVKKFFRTAAKRIRAGYKLFVKRGGLRGLWRRFVKRAKKLLRGVAALNPRSLAWAGGILFAVIGIPVLIALLAAPKPAASQSELEETGPEVFEVRPETTIAPKTSVIHLEVGDSDDEIVPRVQQRLMDLLYMDSDETTTKFGQMTSEALSAFQRRHQLEVSGILEDDTFVLLMSQNALVYSADVGDSGADIGSLQDRLVDLGYMEKSTDYYGTETSEAVKVFQSRNSLAETGSIDDVTKEMLYSEDAKANALSFGAESDKVKTYQEKLIALGYLSGKADGKFGNATVAAIKRFQERNGLIPDGYIGPQTRDMLMSGDAQYNALSLGMTGSDITSIQQRLVKLNYLKSSSVTGKYGPLTATAVQAFQKKNGLGQDGKVGKNTMSKLFSSSAKKADKPITTASASAGSSGSSGSGSSKPVDPTYIGSATATGLIEIAKDRLGCRYRRGAKGPDTFDCSGFVYWCLNKAGIKIGYMTSSTWKSTDKFTKVTSLSSLKKGDIIVFKGHVAIAVGDGTMIDASSSNGKVVHRSSNSPWCQRNFICAYRIF